MVQRVGGFGLFLLLIYAANFLIFCEARKPLKHQRDMHHYIVVKRNYFDSPYYLQSYEGSLAPTTPQENPPYCINPPLTPYLPSPVLPVLPSPPPPITSSHNPPPVYTPNPPEFPTPSIPGFEPNPPGFEPSPPGFEPSPPSRPGFEPRPPSPPGFGPRPPSPPGFEPSPPGFEPSPPGFEPSPPGYVPVPPEFSPGPPVFLPPIVYPPPTAPPPPHGGWTGLGLWCVAKPTVPDPIIQEAMNYACGSGADCDSIQPKGACFQPDTLIAHASFAFNSYWQRTKVAGGTCDFGGTAMLITKDPSYDGCRYNIN